MSYLARCSALAIQHRVDTIGFYLTALKEGLDVGQSRTPRKATYTRTARVSSVELALLLEKAFGVLQLLEA